MMGRIDLKQTLGMKSEEVEAAETVVEVEEPAAPAARPAAPRKAKAPQPARRP